jgi:hypothetical protein
MAACGAKNFHKVNFDLSGIRSDGYPLFIGFTSAFGGEADMTIALRNVR